MQSTLHCFGVGVVLFSLAPPAVSFSRGASQTSCREMIPGHIRAQPQDPQHSHVTLRTSASSYLPGQLVTVTVRSSRDFMGFLLQARSVESTGVGVKARTGVGAGVKSMRLGPVLVGGSWTLTPPGTHTLRCLSEGDTLTHSDKQLKRNLSFVWRAPDAPMGDIRFYITVVQSYFVYWAGIESAVVRDGSRRSWSGSNTTGVNGGNSVFTEQDDDITALPALRAHRASNKQASETASPATTVGHPKPKSSGTQSYKSLEMTTHLVLEMNSSATLAFLEDDHLINQVANENKNPKNSESLQNATNGSESYNSATSGSLSGVTEAAGSDTQSFVTHTEDPKTSLFSSNHLVLTAPLSSTGATEMEVTTTRLPNVTEQNITSPLPLLRFLASLPRLKDVELERQEAKIKFQDPLPPPTIPQTKETPLKPHSTTTYRASTNHSFRNANPPRPITTNPTEPIQDHTGSVKSDSLQPWRTSLTQMSVIQDEMGSQSPSHPQNSHPKSLLHSQTSSPKPLLQSQTATSQTFLFSHVSPSKPFSHPKTSLPNPTLQSKSPTPQSSLQSHTTSSLQPLANKHLPSLYKSTSDLPKPKPENNPPGPKTGPSHTSPPYPQLQATALLSSPTQPQPLSSYPQTLPQSIPTQFQGFPQMDQSQLDTPSEASSIFPKPRSQPHSQTGAPQAHGFQWRQIQFSITPQSSNPLLFTSRFDPVSAPNEVKEVTNLQSQAKTKTTSLTTPSPYFSVSTPRSILHSLSFTSTHALSASSRLHPSRDSTLVSIHPSFRSTLFTHSLPSSSSTKNQPKTAPAFSALHSPSPISIPPHFPSVQPSPSYSIPSSNSSSYPPPGPLFSPVLLSNPSSSPFTSSKSIAGPTFSSPSSSTISPSVSSIASTASSISSAFSRPSTPPSSSSTSTFTTTPPPSSVTASFSMYSQSTSPHLGPSPAPLRSLFNPLTPSSAPMPSQKLTLGQNLLIQNHIAPPDPEPNFTPTTQKMVVHLNPKPHPNLDPNFKVSPGHEKPNLPNTDTKPKRPSSPSGTPDKEGKYPDIIPRHSAWEMGMLLGCSAGLGMVLVVGVRYMYRQTCGKRTEVTLNDREREYGRGERGLIHVQECGDLVRVRRIRENSIVLLAEYDIVASPGD